MMSTLAPRKSIISIMSSHTGDLNSSSGRTSDIVKSMLRSTISRTKRRASKWLVPGCADVMVALEFSTFRSGSSNLHLARATVHADHMHNLRTVQGQVSLPTKLCCTVSLPAYQPLHRRWVTGQRWQPVHSITLSFSGHVCFAPPV